MPNSDDGRQTPSNDDDYDDGVASQVNQTALAVSDLKEAHSSVKASPALSDVDQTHSEANPPSSDVEENHPAEAKHRTSDVDDMADLPKNEMSSEGNTESSVEEEKEPRPLTKIQRKRLKTVVGDLESLCQSSRLRVIVSVKPAFMPPYECLRSRECWRRMDICFPWKTSFMLSAIKPQSPVFLGFKLKASFKFD